MFEPFFGFKKTPFGSDPEPRQLFPSAAWTQMRARLEFLVEHRGVGLFTGEVGSGKSTAVRAFLTAPLLNFEMDSRSYLSLVLVGQPLLRRTLSLAMHEALRQRVAVHYHLEGLARDELDAYLDHQLQAAGVREPLFDETARRALYQATKGIPRKVNKLALAALRLAASRKSSQVDEPILLDAAREALL
jgi:type II secretory pathway predicted ATPase ExeA